MIYNKTEIKKNEKENFFQITLSFLLAARDIEKTGNVAKRATSRSCQGGRKLLVDDVPLRSL